jgi:histidinol-phosphate phosphatase family protein
LDRDGTIVVERHYLSDPKLVELIPGAASGLRRLGELGWGRIVVTNQSGIGRGYFSAEQALAVNRRMEELLALDGASIEAIYLCPHTPEDRCRCRKPEPGLAIRAAGDWAFDPKRCVVIGDKPCDIELGLGIGATSVLVTTGYGAAYPKDAPQPHFTVNGLEEAAAIVRRLDTDSEGEAV